MIFFPGMSKIFHDNIRYDRIKFGIDIISLKKVAGGSCAHEIPHSVFLSLFVTKSAQINANKLFLLAKLG